MFITFTGSTSRAGICVACLELTTLARRIVNRLYLYRQTSAEDDLCRTPEAHILEPPFFSVKLAKVPKLPPFKKILSM